MGFASTEVQIIKGVSKADWYQTIRAEFQVKRRTVQDEEKKNVTQYYVVFHHWIYASAVAYENNMDPVHIHKNVELVLTNAQYTGNIPGAIYAHLKSEFDPATVTDL